MTTHKIVPLLLIIVLLSPFALYAQSSVDSCPHITIGQFTVLTANMPRYLNAEHLARVDTFLRSTEHDDEQEHLLAFYTDDSVPLRTMLQPANGRTGMTAQSINWSWSACGYDLNSHDWMDVSLAKTGFSPAVEFGLVVHELSHQDSTIDASAGIGSTSASWWERVGNHAYARTCSALVTAARTACAAIQAILTG